VVAAPWYTRAYWSALELVSPKRAAFARHFHRLDHDADYRDAALLGLRLRGYKSAHSGKTTTPWGDDGLKSADGEVIADREKLIGRSRQAVRDDPIAKGLISTTFPENVVGTGITSQSTAEAAAAKEIEAVWSDRKDMLFPAEAVPFECVQDLAYKKMLEDGDVFVKRSYTPSGELFFELIEADRVLTPLDAQPADSEGVIRDGIERDRYGRIVAAYVSSSHPGDVAIPFVKGKRPTFVSRSLDDFDRVPFDQLYHLKLVDRPGQSRGIPFLTQVLQDLHDLDLLILAVLKRTQIAACLAAFIETSQELPDLLDVTGEKYGYQLDQDLIPGMIFKLYPGEKVSTLSPNFPIGDFKELVILLARRIGAALGVSWQIVLKDFSGANYSSARTDLLEARMIYRRHQAMVISLSDWIRRATLEDSWLRGDPRISSLTPDELCMSTWIPPGWQWVDPQKEAAAAKIELEIGLTCLRDLAAQRGKDWEDLVRQRLAEEVREKELREELGLGPAAGPMDPPPGDDPEDDEDDEEEPQRNLRWTRQAA